MPEDKSTGKTISHTQPAATMRDLADQLRAAEAREQKLLETNKMRREEVISAAHLRFRVSQLEKEIERLEGILRPFDGALDELGNMLIEADVWPQMKQASEGTPEDAAAAASNVVEAVRALLAERDNRTLAKQAKQD